MSGRVGEHDPAGPYSAPVPPLLLRRADLGGPRPVDVLVDGGVVVGAAGPDPDPRAEVVDAGGGALLPGLHDHHVHLRALAAARRSVSVGPPAVTTRPAFEAALRTGRARAREAGRSWIRAVGYHESVAGELDRWALDAVVDDVPLRVQHRSGALWVVNSRGVEALGLDDVEESGVGRDGGGRPDGRLFRMDEWLRLRADQGAVTPDGSADPDLEAVSRAAAARGVTGFTDATPGRGVEDLAYWGGVVASGRLPQRLTLMWSLDPALEAPPAGVSAGPVKLLLDDVDLPGPEDLAGLILRAHRDGRPVAVHCVTRAQVVVTTAALGVAGVLAGDRIEHGSVLPHELLSGLAAAGLTVVTNPSFVYERGDRYLEDVEPADRPDLYRCASLVEAGVVVAAGTDAPFGNPDPWVSVRAAVERRTARGAALGPGEAVGPGGALGLFTGRAGEPGRARRVAPGEPADLVLLDRPWRAVLEDGAAGLSEEVVRATVVGGRVVHERP